MLIITAVGGDRPGMAHALSSILAEAGCNIEDTTMTRLSGEFAMILIVSLPDELSLDEVQTRLIPLQESHGLFINCKEIEEHATAPTIDVTPCILSTYGPDRVGLVAGITGVLAAHGANITDLQTRVTSGGAVYIMVYELEVPTASLPALQAALDAAGRTMNVQISLRAEEEDVM